MGEGGKPPKTKRITGKQTLMIIILIRVVFQRKILGIPVFSYLVKSLRLAIISST